MVLITECGNENKFVIFVKQKKAEKQKTDTPAFFQCVTDVFQKCVTDLPALVRSKLVYTR
jgi:hypothetical protein